MGRFGILSDTDYDSDAALLVGASALCLPSSSSSSAVARLRSGSKNDDRVFGEGTASPTNEDLEYSDDDTEDGEPCSSGDDNFDEGSSADSDDEAEPPHPLGFVRGPSSRYAVDWLVHRSKESALENYKRRMGYSHTYALKDRLLDDPNFAASPPRQQYPPLASYLDSNVASTLDLVEVARAVLIPTAPKDDNAYDYKVAAAVIRDHEIQEIVDLFATTLGDERSNVRAIGGPPLSATVVRDPLAQLSVEAQTEPYRAMQLDQRKIRAELESVRGPILKEHQERRHRLTQLIREQENEARRIQDEIDRRRLDAERAEMQKQVEEQERLEEGERSRADAAQRKKEEEDDERTRLQQEQEKRAAEQERSEAARAAAEPEHVARAHKLVSQLVQVRASVEPFEASTAPTVKRRRLQMKKLVAGKVNTLTESADKVRSVAAEVSQAIAAARNEDEQVKQQLAANAHGVSSEMARGKRYLIDLLSSKVIVRVQAEGFNGTRGDGFPLANMLALVSVDSKDLVPVLTAHIYTVCPTAIPSLPNPAPNASEEELMESLGMLKKDDGTFETFEHFLHRTESIISLVADIMASNPPTHSLLGGHEAAITWLSRFLELLPKAPESPLPLLTAPVLDAFLTGAGHMLANKHPDEFKAHLDSIMNDILKRLDEGSIGAPSATRLKKTVGDGFESFKRNLPSKALPELYYGASESAGHATSSFASALSTQLPTTANPFGPPKVSNPFQTSAAAQPFGSSTPTAPSFGGSSTTGFNAPLQSPFNSGASPFGGGAPSGASLFGGGASSGPSPFGGGASAAASQPFGNTSAPTLTPFTPSTIMDSGMDATDPPSASPFAPAGSLGFAGVATSSFAPSAPSSFASTTAPSPGPFSQPTPTPFGVSPAPSPSPFGTFGSAAPTSSLFGSSAPGPSPFATASGFGPTSTATQNPSPFGVTPGNPPTFGSTQNPSPFGPSSSNPSPFSTTFGSSAPNPSPFAVSTINQNPTAFGSAPANPSPFTSAVSTNNATPFGAAPLSSSSTFGTSSTPFGQSPSPSPFSQTGGPGTSLTGFGMSPFGNAASTPFGSSGSPFGAPPSTPFSSSMQQQQQQQQPSAYGGRKQIPCRYFAQGNCRFGANCNFSHDSPAQTFNTPFGGPRR